jgi:hypothetical protein
MVRSASMALGCQIIIDDTAPRASPSQVWNFAAGPSSRKPAIPAGIAATAATTFRAWRRE